MWKKEKKIRECKPLCPRGDAKDTMSEASSLGLLILFLHKHIFLLLISS